MRADSGNAHGAVAVALGAMGALGMMDVLGQVAVAADGESVVVPFEIRNGGIDAALVEGGGDPERGRQVVVDAQRGNCLICHTVPDVADQRFHGDIGPSLAGVGARMGEARLRLRIVDSTRINPDSVMPAYHRTAGLNRVAAQWRDKPVLTAAEVEDVVAYLRTLRAANR